LDRAAATIAAMVKEGDRSDFIGSAVAFFRYAL
jgi:hypothetical protein